MRGVQRLGTRRLLAGSAAAAIAAALATAGIARGATPEDPTAIWVARYDSSSPGALDASPDLAESVAVSPDGSTVYVTGSSSPGASADYATLAYRAESGEEIWLARYDGPAGGTDEATSLAVSPDGTTVYVTGSSSNDYATVAYRAEDGEQLWITRTESGGKATSLALSPDGSTVYVTGSGSGDYVTAAYAAATGAELWVTRYDGPDTPGWLADTATSLGVSRDGATVYVAGESGRLNNEGKPSFPDYATVAYAAKTGSQRWVARYDRGSSDVATSLAVAPDDATVYVTGQSSLPNGFGDYATVAYSAATGEQVWVGYYDAANKWDRATALAVSPDGATVYVTGASEAASSITPHPEHLRRLDYATVAYSAARGDERWVARYDGPSNSADWATSIATSPDGATVYVTGRSVVSDRSADYATVAYSASAEQSWVARYSSRERSLEKVGSHPAQVSGPGWGRHIATSIAVSPDGSKVFVTGSATGLGSTVNTFNPGLTPRLESDRDYATVAYWSCGALLHGPAVVRAAVHHAQGANCARAQPMDLNAHGYRDEGLQKADLDWSGATSNAVDVFRDGELIDTTDNDGFYTDHINQRSAATYTYLVCEAGTSTCSNEASVDFGGPGRKEGPSGP